MEQVQLQSPVPSASESLAKIHALFGANSRVGMAFDNLPSELRAALCFGARLGKSSVDKKLADMDDVERAKLHRFINKMSDALRTLNICSLSDFH